MKARLRFAPSPTGPLHIGGVRTALYNYLLAKNLNGDFILRIEDTDQERFVEGAESYIIESLEWLGINIEEGPRCPGSFGPYRQSERKSIYLTYAKKLVEKGWAYYAFDTAEELDALRAQAVSKNEHFVYGPSSRTSLNNSLVLTPEEVERKILAAEPYVIRFKTPENEILAFEDSVRGNIRVETRLLDDKVLMKADQMPTYHLANVVDDHLMQITHVVRGEEWLPSLALHMLLYRAFDWTPPLFAHLPLLLKPSGKGKLSKRDGEAGGFPVFPIQWGDIKGFKESGYEPEAVVNFLALIGWNPGTEQELFTLEELCQQFSIDRVQKAGAKFDIDKLNWFNAKYIQSIDNQQLVFKLKRFRSVGLENQMLERAFELVKDRLTKVGDLLDDHVYLFHTPTTYDEKAVAKQWKPETSKILSQYLSELEVIEFESRGLKMHLQAFCEENGLGLGKVMAPLRISLVGSLQGPSVDELMDFLGKKEVVTRIERAIEHLG